MLPKFKSLEEVFRIFQPRHGKSFKLIVCLSSNTLLNIVIYYVDASVLVENTPLIKFIRNYIRDTSGVFPISSHASEDIDDVTDIIKLYFNSLVYDRNNFGPSSKVFGSLQKMFRNNRLAFGIILENLWKVVGNLQKIVQNAVISVAT